MAKSDPWLKRLPEDELPAGARALIPDLQAQVLKWHRVFGRHDLPWQVSDPYAVWVSEIMLQQTQVATGMYRYPSWMSRFPTLESLAQASQAEVVKEWEGLGYYARARNLHAAAQLIAQQHGGQFPSDRASRLALPGVGPSTASAIGAFGFGLREPILDGNVMRVWARWWADAAPSGTPAQQSRFWWGWVHAATPDKPEQVGAWTQAMMDLGATVCTPKNPRCDVCPLRSTCRGFASGEPERWPMRGRKTLVKDWEISWAWVVKEGKVAVVQRPAGGPWHGLWVLPEAPTPPGSMELGQGKHALSHRRIAWSIHAHSPKLVGDEVQWVDAPGFAALALPKPLRAWWQGLSPAVRLSLFES